MATLTPAAAPFPSERELDWRYHADLLWRSRLLILAAVLGGLALAILVAEVQTPQFRARTLLQVAPPAPTSMNVADALMMTGNPIRDRQFFNTQLNVLYSRALAERVIQRLKLTNTTAQTRHLRLTMFAEWVLGTDRELDQIERHRSSRRFRGKSARHLGGGLTAQLGRDETPGRREPIEIDAGADAEAVQ